MPKKTSEYSFGYVARIEDEKLEVFVKNAKGIKIDSFWIDLDDVKDLTFEDEAFGGGDETPYPFGDWLIYKGLWIVLSERTSGVKGIGKLAAMKAVLSLWKTGRFKKEREGGPGSTYSYLYAAIADLRSEDGKPTTYKQVAASRKRYNDEQWKAVQEQFGDRLPERIKALKAADDAEDEVDLL